MSRIHEQAGSTMVTVDHHYKNSPYWYMFVALCCLLGKRQAQPQMPKHSAWKPSIQPAHTPGALRESLGQVTHYLDEIHRSPSEPNTPRRRPSQPGLHDPR